MSEYKSSNGVLTLISESDLIAVIFNGSDRSLIKGVSELTPCFVLGVRSLCPAHLGGYCFLGGMAYTYAAALNMISPAQSFWSSAMVSAGGVYVTPAGLPELNERGNN